MKAALEAIGKAQASLEKATRAQKKRASTIEAERAGPTHGGRQTGEAPANFRHVKSRLTRYLHDQSYPVLDKRGIVAVPPWPDHVSGPKKSAAKCGSVAPWRWCECAFGVLVASSLLHSAPADSQVAPAIDTRKPYPLPPVTVQSAIRRPLKPHPPAKRASRRTLSLARPTVASIPGHCR
jgi:hypothetical protein